MPVIFDDSLPVGQETTSVIRYPLGTNGQGQNILVNPGYLILLETDNPSVASAAQAAWALNHAVFPPKSTWSDVISFSGNNADLMSWDGTQTSQYPSPGVNDEVRFLAEAFGPDPEPDNGIGGSFTTYTATSTFGSYTYKIESVIPEPALLGLLSLGALVILRRHRA